METRNGDSDGEVDTYGADSGGGGGGGGDGENGEHCSWDGGREGIASIPCLLMKP